MCLDIMVLKIYLGKALKERNHQHRVLSPV
jgi:hypothetical protein